MVKSWGEYLNLAEKANNATGVTLENQKKYAESLDGKIQNLSTTMQSAWNNLLDENSISPIINILSKLANAIDFVTEKAGLLGTIGLGAGLFGFREFVKNFA